MVGDRAGKPGKSTPRHHHTVIFGSGNGIWKPLANVCHLKLIPCAGLGKCLVWSSEQPLEPFGCHLLVLARERCSSTSSTSFFQGLEVP